MDLHVLLLLAAGGVAAAGAWSLPPQSRDIMERDACSTAVGACMASSTITTGDDFKKYCKTLSQKRTCLTNVASNQCAGNSTFMTRVMGQMDGLDYLCSASIQPLYIQELPCLVTNKDKLKAKYTACASAQVSGCPSLQTLRTCMAQAVKDCCPNFCPTHDVFVYHVLKGSVGNCTWTEQSNTCSSVTGNQCV